MDRLEAVDDDDRRLFALDSAHDRAERIVRALGSQRGAEIDQDDLRPTSSSSK